MSLPKLKSNFYTVELPVAKRKIKYRPFLVGEENRLLLAKESRDEAAVAEAVSEIVSIVTEGKVDSERDSYVDVVFVFMLARARAVSETANISFECGCEKKGLCKATVAVTDVRTEVPETERDFGIGEGENGEIRVTLRPLSFVDFLKARSSGDKGDITILRSCIERMYDDETTYDHKNVSDEDWQEFYLNMPRTSYGKIETYLRSQPRAYILAKGVCEGCKQVQERRIEGLSNFT